jgi:hypothetical protein
MIEGGSNEGKCRWEVMDTIRDDQRYVKIKEAVAHVSRCSMSTSVISRDHVIVTKVIDEHILEIDILCTGCQRIMEEQEKRR